MNKIIFHIDANCFFARCEEIKNPKLEDIPFVVAERGKRIGVVSCANSIARQFNIKAGMKVDDALKKRTDLQIVKNDHTFYMKKSNELFECIKQQFDCDIEIFSIDECFLDVTKIIHKYHNNWNILANIMKNKITTMTKIHVTIGVGDNKFLAKMAGDLKPKSGVASIFKNEIEDKLWPLSIEKMFMVGKKTASFFHNLNIKTIRDFIEYPNQEYLAKKLMKHYQILSENALGEGDDFVDSDKSLSKSISAGVTFEIDCNNLLTIQSTMKTLCNKVWNELQAQNLLPITIGIKIKYNYLHQISKTKTMTNFICTKNKIYHESFTLLEKLWDGNDLRSINIFVANLKPKSLVIKQPELFEIN